MWHSTLSLVLALSLPPAAGGPSARPVTVPLRLAGHLPVVRVTVDGGGPYDFAIDTGSTTTIVDARLARDRSLAGAGTLTVVSAGGPRQAPRARVARLSVGGVDLGAAAPLVMDLAGLRSVDRRIAGVLGQDVLSRINLLVDYRAKTLTLDPGGVWSRELRGVGAAVPFDLTDGRPVVEVRARGGRTLRLALDTAAEICTLFERAPGVLSGLRLGHWQPWTVETYLGTTPAAVGELVSLDVGSARLDRGDRPREDGLLPLSLFAAVYLDNERGEMVILRK